MLGNRLNNISGCHILCFGSIFFSGWLGTKCSCEVHQAIKSAPVICNNWFTPTPEQDGDIHSIVNVLCFYFYIVSTMWRKCCGLIDLDKHGSADL